jgi:glycosyltransferase involved in cell wall biosynthesis
MRGYDYALQAVKLLADRGLECTYRIVGYAEFIDAVALARHQLGLEDTVTLLRGGDEEARDALRQSDVLLNASVTPSSPKLSLDALALGVAVVTTEQLPVGSEAALVVPRRDPVAIAGAIGSLTSSPTLRARLADAGRRAVEDALGQERLSGFAELYRRLIGPTGG